MEKLRANSHKESQIEIVFTWMQYKAKEQRMQLINSSIEGL